MCCDGMLTSSTPDMEHEQLNAADIFDSSSGCLLGAMPFEPNIGQPEDGQATCDCEIPKYRTVSASNIARKPMHW